MIGEKLFFTKKKEEKKSCQFLVTLNHLNGENFKSFVLNVP